MADAESDSLENLLNLATNPLQTDSEDGLDYITRFCDQVNKEFDGPHDAVQLLMHKIISPQEKEALLSLTVLEVCVKNCGHRFHAEIGKFRFLNEMIKIISPKYLGSKRSDKVKTKCIELMYCWTKALAHETKIVEAYGMLKKQGIIKEDPCYMDKACDLLPVPKPRPKKAVFEDEDKSKLLARLLKSKHPEDLQAANRLIKNMVKQDAEKNERVSRRLRELETVSNNSKLLVEMMDQYNPRTSTQSECDVMKELHEALEKHRPALFRLASEADDKDSAAMKEILEANDAVVKVVERYKALFGDSPTGDGPSVKTTNSTSESKKDALLDLGFDSTPAPPSSTPQTVSSSLVESELASLGLDDFTVPAPSSMNNDSSLDVNDLFGASHNTSTLSTPHQSPFHIPPSSAASSAAPNQRSSPLLDALGPATASPAPPAPSSSRSSALADLDFLGQTMMQQNLATADKHLPFIPSSELNQKPSLNQLKQSQLSSSPQPVVGSSLLDDLSIDHHLPSALSTNDQRASPQFSTNQQRVHTVPANQDGAPSPTPDARQSPTMKHNPTIPGPPTLEQLSLQDVFVPLESIKPATVPSITIYEKSNIKIVIHFGETGPKPHILVMVVSTMSSHNKAVKDFVFQAAVPKLMRVKLQPPSMTDLPPHNPFLPPSAITQVMLLANPQKEQIRLKFKLDYKIDDQAFTDSGEYDKFPVQ